MKTLYVGYKAADIKPEMLDDGAVFHVLDVYHRHAIEKIHHARSVCAPHLPDGPWDVVKFKTGPKLMSGELALDLLQECCRFGCRVDVDFVGRECDRNDLLDKVKDRADRKFRATWFASVPRGPRLEFVSYPGCFCHRRLDEGGLALAEVVCRDNPRGRMLDMGCGCGLVGFLVKSTSPDLELVMIDSHSRAVEAALENSSLLKMPAEVILADDGIPSRMEGTFDAFVGNPPYYSDYRIADVFLETASRALKPNGVCYTVCKNAAGLEPVQARYFRDVQVLKRRGYAILKSYA